MARQSTTGTMPSAGSFTDERAGASALADLIDWGRIQELTDVLYDAGGIPSAIIDLDGIVLTGSGWQPLCAEFHRRDPVTRQRCITSDTVLSDHARTSGGYAMYRCPQGLIDCVIPFLVEGRHVANIFTGQFLFEPPDLERFRKQAAELGFDEKAYLDALAQVPIVDERRVKAHLQFLARFAELISEMVLAGQRHDAASAELRDSEARYRSLFEDSPVAMWEEDHSAVKTRVDQLVASGVEDIAAYLLNHPEEHADCLASAVILDVNRAAVRLYEAASREELIEHADELDLQEGARNIRIFWAAMAAGQYAATYEESVNTLSGRRIDVRETCMVAPGHEHSFDRVFIADVDLTEQKRAEASLAHVNRLRRTVSDVNQMIVRQSCASSLLSEACRIFVETGGFAMAWVGLCSRQDEPIVPVAAAGVELSFLKGVQVRYDDSPEGSGPSGRAIRCEQAVVCEDLATDPMIAPWRAVAKKRGYRSSATVPIRVGDRIEGVLSVYATEPAAVQPEELALLEELADDIGYALQALRDAATRERTETALRASEARYRRIVETAAEGIAMLDAERRLTYVNAELCHLLGYEADELTGTSLDALLFPEDVPSQLERWPEGHSGATGRHEVRLRGKGGSPRWVSVSAKPVLDEEDQFAGVLAMVTDIQARKRAEERARSTLKRLRLSVHAAVKTLARTIEIRDPYTSGHQERVAGLALAIGERLKLQKHALTSLSIAALIHDLGKIAIPAEILSKPGGLTATEWQLIRQHPQTAYEILKEMEFPGPVATIIRQHHERLNGSGYPRGLTGDEITLGARVLAVADVVEAMSSHRPYRAGLGIDAALEEIESKRGELYDAEVVDACVQLFREDGFALSRPAV